ncbi:MAG: hypothetical protein ABI877_16830 [Gemmatimonadaceae bacterium]
MRAVWLRLPLLLLPLVVGCSAASAASHSDARIEPIDLTSIPADTIDATTPTLVLVNGLYYHNQHLFSGFVRERYPDGATKRIASYARGMQHGVTRTFYPDGRARDVRSYRDNVGYGRHVGFWDNGNIKFDFLYVNDRREGLQKQWYRSGTPYAFLTFHDDREQGMQQAWRESGRPYINYEVRDGVRYGLQKSALCYTIEDGEVQS